MGQVLHGCATTTGAIRRAIQNNEESLRALSKRYGIKQKTVAKWRKRTSAADLPTGPGEPKSTVLSGEDEAIIVAFRRHTLLPLDDCLYSLQAMIPHLPDRPCIVVCSVMASLACRMSRVTSLARRRSKPTRLVSSTSTLPRCKRQKANYICMLALHGNGVRFPCRSALPFLTRSGSF